MSTVSTITLTEDQFDIEFQPQLNLLNQNASWDGCLYETYGEELAYVFRTNPRNVWTWVESDEGLFLISGLHFVNRLGYLITAQPWSHDCDYLVPLEQPDE